MNDRLIEMWVQLSSALNQSPAMTTQNPTWAKCQALAEKLKQQALEQQGQKPQPDKQPR
jgi:hypothetical protein